MSTPLLLKILYDEVIRLFINSLVSIVNEKLFDYYLPVLEGRAEVRDTR